jgi:sulfur carrier protein
VVIRLNGDPYEIPEPVSVAGLLTRLDIDPRRVAVEHNLVVVKKDAFERVTVGEGDEIEIVNFVGGG